MLSSSFSCGSPYFVGFFFARQIVVSASPLALTSPHCSSALIVFRFEDAVRMTALSFSLRSSRPPPTELDSN